MNAPHCRPGATSHRLGQRGVATLLVSVSLFLVALLVMLYANRGAIAEQRMSANEVRAKQAFAQAIAGLDHALAYMRGGGIDQNNDNAPEQISADQYRAAYCSLSTPLPACPASLGNITCTAPTDFVDVQVLACGWSDDNSAVQRVSQRLRGASSTAGNAATPLVSKAATDLLTGGASIFNYFNDLTVWSGGATLGQSNTGKTFIRNAFSSGGGSVNYRDTGNSPACNNPPTGYTCSTQGSTIGYDVVTGDTALSSLTSSQYFERFFGLPPDIYKSTVVTQDITAAQASALSGVQSQVIWVTGDVTLPGGTIGTEGRPVILIVDGVLNLGSNTVINGLVYSSGGLTGNGTATIYGALITAGTAQANGNLKIIYDPNVISKVSSIGRAGKVAGTFRDW